MQGKQGFAARFATSLFQRKRMGSARKEQPGPRKGISDILFCRFELSRNVRPPVCLIML
jgi:hypothetical protein